LTDPPASQFTYLLILMNLHKLIAAVAIVLPSVFV